ncbi:MAG TPA: CAP domain-containing protein [Candidatus Moranbacteria bacterium]|nr:CAP domain-containing protein [Candidatus Moranbacteria bacterium]
MIKKLKIKLIEEFFVETVAIAVMFFIFAAPIIASEITPDKVIKLVNIAREKEGLEPLIQSDTLMRVAGDKLNDMIDNNYFAHTSPTGKTPWSWFEKENYDYKYAGENLAINYESAEEQQAAWMKSPTHRKNILNPNYKEIGVAFGAGEIKGDMSLIAIQEFGTRAGAMVASKEGENFIFQKGSELLQESTKIIPQVLSVKSQKAENSKIESKSNVRIDPSKIWPEASDSLSLVSVLLLLGSLVLLPISFLAVAYDKIYLLYEMKKN